MSERIILPGGGEHIVSPERPYTNDDLRLELAAFEGRMSDKEKAMIEILGNTIKTVFYDDLIGSLPLKSQAENRTTMLGAMEGIDDMPQEFKDKFTKKKKLLEDIDESVRELGIDLSGLEDKHSRLDILNTGEDSIEKLFIELHNKGYKTEDILPSIERKPAKVPPPTFYNQ